MDGDTSRDFLNQCRTTFVTAFHLLRGSTASSPATAQAEMSHLHREIASLPHRRVCLYIASQKVEARPTENEKKKTRQGVINLKREKTQDDERGVALDLTDATLILFRHSLEVSA